MRKEQQEAVSQTDNIMTKRKSINGQKMIHKILHRKLKIDLHRPHYNRKWIQVLRKDYYWFDRSCFVSDVFISQLCGRFVVVLCIQ